MGESRKEKKIQNVERREGWREGEREGRKRGRENHRKY